MKRDYLSIAHNYALDVVAGKIPACLYAQQACQRYLRDIKAAESPDFPWTLDGKRAAAVCGLIELLPHIKGPKAGQKFILGPWQIFVLVNVFGWVHKQTKKRRFRKAYIEVPRGNGKSALSAGVGLYCMAADGEPGAEVYSVATTKDQARIVFETAQHMARKSLGFRRRFGVTVPAHAIAQPHTISIFKALAADSDKLDGLNTHLGIIDELHAHPNRGVYDVLETSTAKRDQSLLWIITTAGTDQSGICFEVRDYITKVLSGAVADDRVFGIIYGLDEGDDKRKPPIPGDDWTEEKNWSKANPNWNVSVNPEAFAALVKEAINTPSKQNNVKTKYFDLWCGTDVAWLDMLKWRAGADPELRVWDFTTDLGWGALDVASKTDVAVALRLFLRVIDGARHYYCFPKFWLPEAAIRESSNSQYAGWVNAGYINVTSGNVIDLDEIERELKSWISEEPSPNPRFQITEIAFDPFQATQISTHMQEEGFQMVELGATVKNFSEPMKELDALVRDGRFHHDGNPVLTWMASNVMAHYDHKDNIFPNKLKPENKIDGIIAAIMALNRALVYKAPVEPTITLL